MPYIELNLPQSNLLESNISELVAGIPKPPSKVSSKKSLRFESPTTKQIALLKKEYPTSKIAPNIESHPNTTAAFSSKAKAEVQNSTEKTSGYKFGDSIIKFDFFKTETEKLKAIAEDLQTSQYLDSMSIKFGVQNKLFKTPAGPMTQDVINIKYGKRSYTPQEQTKINSIISNSIINHKPLSNVDVD